MKLKTALRLIKQHHKIISMERDNLRDIYEKIEEELEGTESALEDLQCCIDRLSERV